MGIRTHVHQSLHARKWLSSFKRTKGYSRPYSMAAAAGLAGNLKESCGNRERVQEIIRKEKTLGGLQLLVMSARWHGTGIAVGHLAPSGARLTPRGAGISFDCLKGGWRVALPRQLRGVRSWRKHQDLASCWADGVPGLSCAMPWTPSGRTTIRHCPKRQWPYGDRKFAEPRLSLAKVRAPWRLRPSNGLLSRRASGIFPRGGAEPGWEPLECRFNQNAISGTYDFLL